jgi:hypothetical protein
MALDSQAPARPAPSRPLSAVSWTLGAVAVIAFGVAIMLGFTNLWETPNTSCGQVATSLVHSRHGCDAIVTRREHWMIAVGVVMVVLAALAVALRGRGWDRPRPTALVVAVLLAAIAAGISAAGRLTVGDRECGSTLSRVDEFGTYNPGKPQRCAPRYDDARAGAWAAGAISVAGLLCVPIGAALTSARQRRPPKQSARMSG